jgi:hypothetical protein
MIVAKVTVKGIRPLVVHHFVPEILDGRRKDRSGTAGNDPDEWKRTVLKTDRGQLYITPEYVFGCLREGARHTRRGKGSIQRDLVASLQVIDSRILIDRFVPRDLSGFVNAFDRPVYLDVRSVVNPTTRKRNIRYRVATSPGWSATFRIRWDRTIVSKEEMEAVIRDGGAYSGFGDGRSIGFGRFELIAFDAMEGGAHTPEKTTKRSLAKSAR